MKTKLLTLLTLVPAAAFCATFVPQASTENLANNSLSHGELAWTTNAFGATAWVGSPKSATVPVADPFGLHATAIVQLDQTQYAVAADDGWTHDETANTYTMTSGTNCIAITINPMWEVTDFTVESVAIGGGFAPATILEDLTHTNNVYYYYCCLDTGATAARVDGFTVKARLFGSMDYVNDATTYTWRINDRYGEYNLNDLRHELYNRDNGNRGENWSRYNAESVVHANGYALILDTNDVFQTVATPKKRVDYAGGVPAITMDFGTNVLSGTIVMTNISQIVSNATDIAFRFSVTNNGVAVSSIADGLLVLYRETLDSGVWEPLDSSRYTIEESGDSGIVHVTDIPSSSGTGKVEASGFFKLSYRGLESEALHVRLRGTVVIEGEFVVKGTDGKWYKMAVSGGAATFTEVAKP